MTADSFTPRIVFFGYGELAHAVLRTVHRAGADLAAVVVPGNRTGEAVDLIVGHAVAADCETLVQPPRARSGPFVDRIRELGPDLMLIASYSMLLPPALLAIPPRGTVNVHTGLLPEYRGGHVLQWAILNGEAATGVTLHYVDEGIDTGPIIAHEEVLIAADDDAVSVKAKLQSAAVALVETWWRRIAEGTAPRISQPEPAARYWPMRTPEQGRIDWSAPAMAVCRLIRALAANVPGAYVEQGDRIISVVGARPLPCANPAAAPGSVVAVEPAGLRIAAADGDVLVTDVVVDGRRLSGAALSEITGVFLS